MKTFAKILIVGLGLTLGLAACGSGSSGPNSNSNNNCGGGNCSESGGVVSTVNINPSESAITAEVGESLAVTLTFNASNGTVSSLQATDLSSSLPSNQGWTSESNTFNCPTIGESTGDNCTLSLTFAPKSAESGSFTLNFSYINSNNESAVVSQNISYTATQSSTPMIYIVNQTGSDALLESTPVNIGSITYCPLSQDGSLNYDKCKIVTGSESNPLFYSPQGIAINNDHLYVTNYGTGSAAGFITKCNLNGDGHFSASDCSIESGIGLPTGSNSNFNLQGITINNNTAYVINSNANNPIGIYQCKISSKSGEKGDLSCSAYSNAESFAYQSALTTHANNLYIAPTEFSTSSKPGFISACPLGESTSACSEVDHSMIPNLIQLVTGIAFNNDYVYITGSMTGMSQSTQLAVCKVSKHGSKFNSCAFSTALNGSGQSGYKTGGIAFYNNFAYVSAFNGTNGLYQCQVNSEDGNLYSCSAYPAQLPDSGSYLFSSPSAIYIRP